MFIYFVCLLLSVILNVYFIHKCNVYENIINIYESQLKNDDDKGFWFDDTN